MFAVEDRPLTSAARVAIGTDGQYYLLASGSKHWMSSEAVRNRCGFDYSKATTENLDSFVMGKVITLNPEDHIFQCQLVQIPGQAAIYFAHENELHHVPSPTIFDNVFTSAMWKGVKGLKALPLPIGNPMTNAELIVADGVTYLVYDNTAHRIADSTTFNKCGFNSAKAKTDTASVLKIKTLKKGPALV